MLLSEVSDEGTKICDKYYLSVAPGDFLQVEVPVTAESPTAKLTLPNLAGRQATVLEFKHSTSTGRKWWTQKAGVELHFFVRKDKIEVVPECGYSYPKVKIAGLDYSFSCSGGTIAPEERGWLDMLGRYGHLLVNLPLKKIRHLAEQAANPAATGMAVDLQPLTEDRKEQWQNLVLAALAPKLLRPFDLLYPKQGRTWSGSSGPFAFHKKTGKTIFAGWSNRNAPMGGIKATANDFDWLKTAKANHWQIPDPDAYSFACQ